MLTETEAFLDANNVIAWLSWGISPVSTRLGCYKETKFLNTLQDFKKTVKPIADA
jgi:hypothetical protein